MRSDYISKNSGAGGFLAPWEQIKAARTLDAEKDSGKSFRLDSAGGAYTITLPTATTGLDGTNYKFWVEENTPTGAITIAAGSAIIDIVGVDIAQNDGPSSASSAKSNILIGTATKQGDYIDIFHDGTSWYAESLSSTAGSITTS